MNKNFWDKAQAELYFGEAPSVSLPYRAQTLGQKIAKGDSLDVSLVSLSREGSGSPAGVPGPKWVSSVAPWVTRQPPDLSAQAWETSD